MIRLLKDSSKDELRKKYFSNPISLLNASISQRYEEGILLALELSAVLKLNPFIPAEFTNNDHLAPGIRGLISDCSTNDIIEVINNIDLYKKLNFDNFSDSNNININQKLIYLLLKKGYSIDLFAENIFNIKREYSKDYLNIVDNLIKFHLISFNKLSGYDINQLFLISVKCNSLSFMRKIKSSRPHDIDLKMKNEALLVAINDLQPKIVSFLISEKVNVNLKRGFALIEAINIYANNKMKISRQLEIIKLLLDKGVDIKNTFDAHGFKLEQIQSKEVSAFIEMYMAEKHISLNSEKEELYIEHININTIKEIPFFKEAYNSCFYNFDFVTYLKFLNRGYKKDKVELSKLLLNESLKSTDDSYPDSLFLNLAVSLHDLFIPGLKEYEEDSGLMELINWTKNNFYEFYNQVSKLQEECLTIGDHLFYTNNFLHDATPDKTKEAICYGLYYMIKYCLQKFPEKTQTELEKFPRILHFRECLNPKSSIVFGSLDEIMIGLQNKSGKYEFFKATSSMEASVALTSGFLNDDIYESKYCLSDEDEFDLPVVLYEDKVYPEEFDEFKLIHIEYSIVDEKEIYFHLLRKGNIWHVYKLYIKEEMNGFTRFLELVVEEMKDFKGLDLNVIEEEVARFES